MIRRLFDPSLLAVFPLSVKEWSRGDRPTFQIIDANGDAVTLFDAFRDSDTAETIVALLNAAHALNVIRAGVQLGEVRVGTFEAMQALDRAVLNV